MNYSLNMNVKSLFLGCALLGIAVHGTAREYEQQFVKATVAIKVPGNPAIAYDLSTTTSQDGKIVYQSSASLPVSITKDIRTVGGHTRVNVSIKALSDVYFNFNERYLTGYRHDDCLFYMPGFWYRRNLRSPKEAPSFHTSDSWIVREDRLSTPLTLAFDEVNHKATSVIRLDEFGDEALTTHKEGEVIVSGTTSIGCVGFVNEGGTTALVYGFPYTEAPKTYIRKLTLAPQVEAFQFLKKGEEKRLVWEFSESSANDFAECVQKSWEYSYDTYQPKPLQKYYSTDQMKQVLSNYFIESFVDGHPLHYFSGVELETESCRQTGVAEVGFVGRTLLNAFNALEYGEKNGRQELVKNAVSVFDSYLENGFSANGFFKEVINYTHPQTIPNSIRRQSEGIYAILYYLNYEKQQGRKHLEWENKVRQILDQFLKLQNPDGSFPRKFDDAMKVIDASGGSTPSATLPLVLAYKYFKNKRYLEAAKRSVAYLERELISKSDYFSSTLDANCEDKEASLYASTAAYYLALVTKGKERAHYASLARQATYFALSWYYTWDVPFAKGQMLGDLGLRTRGWGNVSVENNHIDVFVFDFADVLHWLADYYKEPRFSGFAEVISTSMRQLLPFEGHMCGVGKVGFYPEVVQHTNWDYGRNGKGFYNNIFAPGWTVASLWELLTPERAEHFLNSK